MVTNWDKQGSADKRHRGADHREHTGNPLFPAGTDPIQTFLQRLNASLLQEKKPLKSTYDTTIVTMLYFVTLIRLQKDAARESLVRLGDHKVICTES